HLYGRKPDFLRHGEPPQQIAQALRRAVPGKDVRRIVERLVQLGVGQAARVLQQLPHVKRFGSRENVVQIHVLSFRRGSWRAEVNGVRRRQGEGGGAHPPI